MAKNGKFCELTNVTNVYGNGSVRIGNETKAVALNNSRVITTEIEISDLDNTETTETTGTYNPLKAKEHKHNSEQAEKAGQTIANSLWGTTSIDDWTTAKDAIAHINKANVHWCIDAYVNSPNSYSSYFVNRDNIIEQIVNEDQPKEEKYNAVRHIIGTVIEHCNKYGINDQGKYDRLKAILDVIGEDDMDDSDSTFEITVEGKATTYGYKDIDRWILSLLDITNKL